MLQEFHQLLEARYGTGTANSSLSEWICSNTTLRKKPFTFGDFGFQRKICDDMHPDLVVEKSSQTGLALAVDTPVPTPSGWTTMGDVAVGDDVYDELGQPCVVEYVSPIYEDHTCYRLTFDDGESIVADAGHRWRVDSRGIIRTVALRVGDEITGPKKTHVFRTIEPTASVPVRCISVSSPSHLFLAGRGMIPTHNTEVQIRKFFAILARLNSRNGIFTLPNEDMFKRIYSGRMSPILKADSVFNPPSDSSPVRRNDLIQIRDSFGYITGCTEGDATSISADILFHDEYDLSPQNIIGLFPSRLQGSDMAITQSFSTPSYINFGINKAYSTSDQHEYMVRCDSCNHWQIPDFTFPFIHIPNLPDDLAKLTDLTITQIAELDSSESYVKCEQCRRRLDLGRTDNREWVARHPNRTTTRGYKVRPFSISRLTVPYILGRLSKAQQLENVRGFHNTVLGNAYTESSAQIQRSDIEKVLAPTGAPPMVGRDRACFMGIDVGQTCHIVIIASKPGGFGYDFVLFDTCHANVLDERLDLLRKTYTIIQGCADRFPYTPTVDALKEKTGGMIVPVQYRGINAISKSMTETGDFSHYYANRTGALDKVKTAIEQQTMVIAGYGPHRETIITHFGDMVRSERPEQEPSWEKISGNDHFHHAAALALLAPRISDDIYTSGGERIGSVVMVKSADWMKNTMSTSLTPQRSRPGALL